MGIYKSLTLWDFEQAFIAADRNYFSKAAYEYLYDLMSEQDEELDVIAVCCCWTEYEDGKALMGDYEYLIEDRGITDEDERVEALIAELEDKTVIVHLSGGSYLVWAF